MRKIRVLELRSVWGTGGGPDKTILAGAALKSDVIEPIVCYIRDARDTVFTLGERARDLGLDYEEVVERRSLDHAVGQRFAKCATTLDRHRPRPTTDRRAGAGARACHGGDTARQPTGSSAAEPRNVTCITRLIDACWPGFRV
jgi:hypothetical protein